MRVDLSDEAIRKARILSGLLPLNAEVSGLLALMLLHDSRREARTDKGGDFVPLKALNRKHWNQSKISEGISILEKTLPKGDLGPYQIQAGIGAVHAQSGSWEKTDWVEIAPLYHVLYRFHSPPVVRINQALAISYARSPQDALQLMADVSDIEEMQTYQPHHAARSQEEFSTSCRVSDNATEKRFLNRRASEV